jgi:NTP pyrophosphatase (non-canonical NTP hydrolase)
MNDTHYAYDHGTVVQLPQQFTPVGTLYFGDLRTTSLQRCARWHPGGVTDWSLDDWLVAVVGELGETLNVVKKLNRERDKIVGNSVSADELRVQLADEIADTVIYLDLLAARLDIDLNWMHCFNKVREVALSMAALFEEETLSSLGVKVSADIGRIAALIEGSEGHNVPGFLPRFEGHISSAICKLDHMALLEQIDLAEAVVSKFNRTSEKNGFPEVLVLR